MEILELLAAIPYAKSTIGKIVLSVLLFIALSLSVLLLAASFA